MRSCWQSRYTRGGISKAEAMPGAPELVAKVERGDVSVSAAADVARLPVPEQRHLDESQRVAAKIAKLPQGARTDIAQTCAKSQPEAADALNVSRRSVQLLDSGREAVRQ
jgi:hypothetical protein